MNVTLHLTPACTMRCDYCYATPSPGPTMSAAVVSRALDFATRNAPPTGVGIVFFGGEPLLCLDRIQDVVGEARDRMRRRAGRFHFKLTTNGMGLTDDVLAWTLQHHVLVAMSFDGVREAHDRHRRLPGGGGTFDLLLPRLRALVAARPFATIYLVVSPDTARHLVDSVSFLLDEGVRHVVISLDHAGAWDEEAFADLEGALARLADLYVTWSRAGRRFSLSPFEHKIASHVQGDRWSRCRCSLAEHQVSVAPDGGLYPCVQFVGAGPEWRVGHVDRGLDLAACATLRHRAGPTEKDPCRTCAIEARCAHTCGCLAWQATGDLAGVSPVLCRYERALTPLADRVGAVLFGEGNAEFLRKHYNPAGPLVALLEEAHAVAQEAPRQR